MTNFIDYLKECKDCLYIYNRNYSIYGLPDKERYAIIVSNSWECPEEWMGFDRAIYHMYTITEWFDLVLKGSLVCWECACLNKKYVIKEFVKLMMTTNALQLRKYIDKEIKYFYSIDPLDEITIWNLIKDIKFSNQIIENHKIINFREAASDYNKIGEKCFEDLAKEPMERLKKLTDGMIKAEQLAKSRK